VATDTIDYVATDTWGSTATNTRTVIIAAITASLPPTDAQRKTTPNKLMQVNNLDHDRDDETPR
jgi:hypothetical protein